MGGSWSEWLMPGHFYSYVQEQVTNYFMVANREWAHIEYTWPERVDSGTMSGPFTVANMELTKTGQIWQVIFGVEPQCRLYIKVPVEIARHGTAKQPVWSVAFSTVGHYESWSTPWDQPSWISEVFMIRPITNFLAFEVFNKEDITIQPDINFFLAKCVMQPIGTVYNGRLTPAANRFTETLKRLYQRTIPHRPLTLMPVRAPAEAP